MSNRTTTEFEVHTQTTLKGRRIIIIEYEVTRKEINRYDFEVKE